MEFVICISVYLYVVLLKPENEFNKHEGGGGGGGGLPTMTPMTPMSVGALHFTHAFRYESN